MCYYQSNTYRVVFYKLCVVWFYDWMHKTCVKTLTNHNTTSTSLHAQKENSFLKDAVTTELTLTRQQKTKGKCFFYFTWVRKYKKVNNLGFLFDYERLVVYRLSNCHAGDCHAGVLNENRYLSVASIRAIMRLWLTFTVLACTDNLQLVANVVS